MSLHRQLVDAEAVLVTSGKSRVAYNILRSLGRKSCMVYVADAERGAMSFASRYARGSFVYPSPFTEPERFKECLLQKIDELHVQVLIPVLEETFLIAKHKDEFAGRVKLVLPDYQQIMAAHNKDRWEPLAAELGIPHPRSAATSVLRAEPSLCQQLRYPVLIKPKQGGGGWGIQVVESADELAGVLAADSYCQRAWERFFVQEKIVGQTHCVAMLFCHGAFRAKVVYKQVREYPPRFGQAVLRESLRNESAETHLQRLLEAMAWHGVCQADFVVDEATGTPYLIDINPRFWGSLAQAIASGVDFPWLLYRMALDGDVQPVPDFRVGIKSRWVGGDLCAFLPMLRHCPEKRRFLRDYFAASNWSLYRDDLDFHDPLPFFLWAAYTVRKAVQKRFSRKPIGDSLQGVWE